MACFKKIDEDETGVIEMDLMENYIKQMGIDFSKDEFDSFKSFIMGSKKD